MSKVCYAKYNRTRSPQFQTKTYIVEDEGKQVVKEALGEVAIEHIRSMAGKYELIKELYQNVSVADVRIENDRAVFPYIDGETVAECLEKNLEDRESLLQVIQKYIDKLFVYADSAVVDFSPTDEFKKIFGSYEKTCKALSRANVDEIFDNFVMCDDTIYLIDYEWVFDFPIPVDYIRFRTLYYFYAKNGNQISKIIDLDEYLAHFGYDKESCEDWLKMDDCYQQYVHGKDRKYIYTRKYLKNNHDLYNFLNSFHDIEGEHRRLHELLHEKEELILLKDKNISDFRQNENVLNGMIESYRENEQVLNKIIEDDRKNTTLLEKNIQELNDKVQNQDEYIQLLRRCMRNPMFAMGQVIKKAGKKVLPPIVQAGLYSLMTEGTEVFNYKVKNYLHGSDQYKLWIENNENDLYATTELEYNPLISVVVPVYNVEDLQLIECIESVRKQTYSNWQLCLVDDCSTMESVRKTLQKYEGKERIKIEYREKNGHISKATNSGIALADGEYIALLDCDDLLAPNALYEMAKKLNENPKYDFIYSDEDKMTEDGKVRKDPFFKPDWSPDTFMSIMYTCHFSIFRKSLVDELGGMRVGYEGSQDYDLVLRVMEKTDQIGHVARILYHWRERKESTAASMTAKPYIIESTKKAKMDALKRRGLQGHLECIESITQFRVVYEPMNNPKVSIIIPSKDNYSVLEQCILSIRNNTDYENYEVIVVDNGSNQENKAKYAELCEAQNCTYHYQPLTFNFSQMCNIGAAEATGDYYLFLNDDIEIQGKEWLSRLLGQAQVPYTGAVGCKLLYPNSNLIQHAGVVNLEIGPGHAFHGFDDSLNYYGRNILDYNFAIVTGACLMVKKEKFEQVNGFNETLPVAYNDVELCFKLLEQGYYNVLRNDVRLVHHESVSRGHDEMTEEKDRRRRKEMEHLYELHPNFRNYDPCYNPNLVQTRGDFSLNMDKGGKLHEVTIYNEAVAENDGVECNIDNINVTSLVKITGWAFVKQPPHAEKVKILLVHEDGTKYMIDTDKVYRPDVRASYGNNKKLAFCGYSTIFNAKEIKCGLYDVYVLCKNGLAKRCEKLEIS